VYVAQLHFTQTLTAKIAGELGVRLTGSSMYNETKGMIYGLVGVSAFGLTLPATRVVVPYMEPIFIGLGRAVLAAIFALILLLCFDKKLQTLNKLNSCL
jgi:hypothetical protein